MAAHDLAEVFSSTRENLRKVGLENDFFLDLTASRLLIERVGESNNQEWWDSRVLSETGRARLQEVTPKTRLQSQINLAMKVGRKAESDVLPDDSISLFSFGPQIEAQLGAAFEDLSAPDESLLTDLEELSVQSLEINWTDPIIEQTASNISVSSISLPEPESNFYQISEEGYEQSEIDTEKWRLLVTLLRGYGQNTERLRVPYYPLNSKLKSENA
ncbi:BrxE family protein [Natrialbaceae archaeon AArc-T1-2]|uniref:BrxE family protein n=1 Tax=Natrialbaceae archaeon AArc-T1-2 TaxID=3053904 RepID=UPI00255AC992|nr:BrxE family protein [Natrialbaceae archaeon AArc-T1-2]WIV67348.1 BrxE family protein [Natrialbaceae archaeon AArc-T1-2]